MDGDRMIYSSGFYKLDGELLYGPNFVLNANYELRKETKDDHSYPIDGWYWFDTLQEACAFHALDISDYEENIVNDN
jgi:hypothetical protein